MKKRHYVTPLFNFGIKGNVDSVNALMQRFIVWCRKIGVNQEEAQALWCAGDETKIIIGKKQEIESLAKEAYEKLPQQQDGVWLDLDDPTLWPQEETILNLN
jgi:hypothetical protein